VIVLHWVCRGVRSQGEGGGGGGGASLSLPLPGGSQGEAPQSKGFTEGREPLIKDN
jgi:hypothetical protein